MAVAEPVSQIERTLGAVEIRLYAPYVEARVRVQDRAERAARVAFPILARYIFGHNRGSATLAMSAPVTRTPVRLEMTAPVTVTPKADSQLVAFILPRQVTLDNAPEPIDSSVELAYVPARRIAAIRFSGRWTQANDQKHLEQLLQTLRKSGLTWVGEPTVARYNPPWTPWFLRRNEIWLELTTDH